MESVFIHQTTPVKGGIIVAWEFRERGKSEDHESMIRELSLFNFYANLGRLYWSQDWASGPLMGTTYLDVQESPKLLEELIKLYLKNEQPNIKTTETKRAVALHN